MELSGFRRIVIKVGSALLVDHAGGRLRDAWLAALAEDIAALSQAEKQVIVVSSGAIALGRTILKLPHGPLSLDQSQAAAAVGQIALAKAWSDALAPHALTAAQVLLTFGDTEERRRYLNARATLFTLLEMGAVPVINENDTVATSEIRYGDNDRLSARIAGMAEADALVLLSDVDGLYTVNPQKDPAARHIDIVPAITAEIEGMAGGAASELSRGGMITKIEAAKMATSAGCAMVIADGRRDHPVAHVMQGGRCTWFRAAGSMVAARKKWIAGSMEPRGRVVVDAGAARALMAGKSLLPAGVTGIEGQFAKGDTVQVRDVAGAEIARGLVAYDAEDARRIMGRNSAAIAGILTPPFREELIHRNDLVILGDAA